jgi:uncharacterized protein YggE
LRDLSQYDALMEGWKESTKLIMVFQSSKLAQYQARKLAMKDAKLKAEDYVSVLGQK